jgi:hypothetical protein
VWAVLEHPQDEDSYVFARVKNNLGPRHQSALVYQIEVEDIAGDDTPKIVWQRAWDRMGASDVIRLEDARNDAPVTRDAIEFLTEVLMDGPVDVEQVRKLAGKAGLGWDTVSKRAAKELRVVKKPVRKGGKVTHWEWSLPPKIEVKGV